MNIKLRNVPQEHRTTAARVANKYEQEHLPNNAPGIYHGKLYSTDDSHYYAYHTKTQIVVFHERGNG